MRAATLKLKVDNTTPALKNSPSTSNPVKLNIKSATKVTPKNKDEVNPSTPIIINPSTPIKLNVKQNTKQNVNTKQDTPTEEYHVNADNYSRIEDQKIHIYERPNMYINSDAQVKRSERVLDLETLIFKEEDITLPKAVENIFLEVVANASDNSARSLRKNIDPGEVVITMDKNRIKVRNGGIPIPVVKKQPYDIWVPEMIFGVLMTSSNYDKNTVRTEIGVNGIGVKITNIFSKIFTILIADPHNGKLYSQKWTTNMRNKEDPIITEYPKTSKGFVEIEYIMDFKRFKYDEYPQEAFALFARHIADLSFTLKIPVSFNGIKFNISNAKEYAKFYLGKETVKSSILYFSWPKGTETITKKGVEYAKEKGILPEFEICAVDTPDCALKVSFVNGKWTRNNGVHLDASFKAVATGVLNTVNESSKKKKDEKSLKLTLGDVKRHVSLFISFWLPDVEFDSQTKTELISPSPKVNIDENLLRPILKWELVSRLYAELEAKMYKTLSKSDGKKRRLLNGMDKLKDAYKAGTSESTNCILYVTEGDSALTFARKLCSYLTEGRDYLGFYPLKGKGLNVMNAPPLKIAENKEINDLKKILGLREGIDYSIDENYETLRYGHLMVCADSDLDGKHILGLIINLFYCRYPSLLARGYIKYLRTKILEAKKGVRKIKFYSKHEYDEWKKDTPDHDKWELFYYKGLGTSEKHDIEEESKDPKIVMTIYDENAPNALRLAFDQNLADYRKFWITNWNPDYSVEQMKIQPISSFINHEFIQFSILDVSRNIPRFTDGLKSSQRKILWAALKKWGKKAGEKAAKMKVAQFAAYISQHFHYAYGEKSLEGAIVGMAQDFVSANNLPYFERNGEFGTRSVMGKDASASRYIFTRPEWWIPYVFKKEDLSIVEIQIEEGCEIEPVTLLPILPMHLINGQSGVGSGFSCNIVNYNPLDICFWLESKIKKCPLPELIPWYRGFEGKISVVKRVNGKRVGENKEDDNESKSEKDNDEKGEKSEDEKNEREEKNESEENNEKYKYEYEDSDEVNIDKNTKFTMISEGCFQQESRKLRITEIPIGRSINRYEDYLKDLREKKIITNYKDSSTPDKPNFEVFGMKNPTLKALKLVKSFGMSNIVLLDNKDKPVKYETVDAVMETFYTVRLGYYQKRKDNILNEFINEISQLNMKKLFIAAVIKGNEIMKEFPNITDDEAVSKGAILVLNKTKKIIALQMQKLGFDIELLQKVTLFHCTREEIENAEENIKKLTEEKKNIEEKSSETIWLEDLQVFIKKYCKHYKCTYNSPKKISLKVVN